MRAELDESEGRKVVPADKGQSFFWLLSRYQRRGALGLPVLLRLRGHLDASALEAALSDLADRHEALRSTYVFSGRRLNRVIAPPGTVRIALPLVDLTGSAAIADVQIRDLLCTDLDLRTSPVRAGLWRIGREDHVFVLYLHHTVTDAWSNLVLRRDLAVLYNAALDNKAPALPPIPTTAADAGSARPERPPARAEMGDHVARLLRDARFPELAPPIDRGNGHLVADAEWFDLGPAAAERLAAIARAEDTTPAIVALTLYLAVLRAASERHRGRRRGGVAACAIFATRARPELRNTVGFLGRTVVVPFAASGPTRAAIREVRDHVRAGMSGWTELAAMQPGRWDEQRFGRPEEAVFLMFPPLSDLDGPPAGMDGLTVTPYRQPDGVGSRFELQLVLTPADDSLSGYIRYARDRFERPFVAGLVEAYQTAVAELR